MATLSPYFKPTVISGLGTRPELQLKRRAFVEMVVQHLVQFTQILRMQQ